jgi:hypothetical protein
MCKDAASAQYGLVLQEASPKFAFVVTASKYLLWQIFRPHSSVLY